MRNDLYRFAFPIIALALAAAGPSNAEPAPMRAGGSAATVATPDGAQSATATMLRGKVLETMNAGNYVYARVSTPGGEKWLAGPKSELRVGDVVEWRPGSEMKNFASKTLDRTFDSIWFVDRIDVAGAAAGSSTAPHGSISDKAAGDVPVQGISRADGGLTVSEIYDGRAKLEGKEIVVRGKVVKSNTGVMQRNWLHLRDGTRGAGGENDLTVTTSGTAKVGDTVVVRGKVALGKDFGFGYRYDVMLETATVTVESTN
jgi:hypothetical protein